MSKKIKSVLKVAAPFAATYFAPGIGTALGLGSGTLGSAVGGALAGGLGGLVTGSNPLQGALMGGAGGYFNNGGATELFGGTKVGDFLGVGKPGEVASGGAISSGVPASAAGGGASSVGASEGGMFSNLFNKDNLKYLGLANSLYGNMEAQDALQKATAQAQGALSPYTGIGSAAANKLGGFLGLGGEGGSTADILAASPGYQFMLEQGNQGLDRANAARGGFFSGAALKAAQDYGTGLANQTAQNYYSQLANTAGLGANAANAFGTNATALGTAKGAANISTANMINQLLSGYNNPYAKLLGA